MNKLLTYVIIFVVLLLAELLYFRIADKLNIIDKPNQRSSHTKVVLRGGGIIFLIGIWIWSAWFGFHYPWALVAVTLAAGISFVDDIHPLPDSVRLAVHFVSMGLMIAQLFIVARAGGLLADVNVLTMWLMALVALIVCVGATNIYNFMDGINGITAAYSLSVLVPLFIKNRSVGFVEESFLVVIILSVLVFSIFNFRPKNKAKCFAGDVGSVGMAFLVLFGIGMLVLRTGDFSWLAFLLLYGVDGCLTICHRILLHENLGEAHRKHAFQILANELAISHPVVSLMYFGIQLAISLVMIFCVPDDPLAHWLYVAAALVILALAYLLFMKKYYHLHEEYLKGLGK